jgi:hypothetical protein
MSLWRIQDEQKRLSSASGKCSGQRTRPRRLVFGASPKQGAALSRALFILIGG